MNLQHIFFNESARLRSGWRFTIFLISYAVIASFLVVGFTSLLNILSVGAGENSFITLIGTFTIFSVCAIFLGWFYGKIFEDLPFRALGIRVTKNWFVNLVLGFLVGALSIGLAALVPFLSGSISFQSNLNAGSSPIILTLSITLLIFITGAVSEEVLFRGYLLQTMSRAKLFSVGLLLTSVLFASAHNANPGANMFTWLNTFLAGIWFCIAYLKTRDLWFPIGIHLAWNWFQGSIFGISVSGLSDLATAPLMRSQDFGPVWLTGGSYGLEGGLSCTIALIVSGLAIWFLPLPKPSEEMLALTTEEKPKQISV